ncbi:MAG: hypothetical protein ABIY70_05315 [Capsulimonas sp.]|uniref:hypothetical protein n=1 Tax=Capsulimonas sp. TaxID=2494211 RepID=UPI0032645CFF
MSSNSLAGRQIEECLILVRQQLEQSGPEELGGTLALFQKVLKTPSVPRPSAKAALVHRLAEGRTYTPAEAAALELAVSRKAFARRQELLAGALSATQVAKLLGTTRQTPHDRAGKGALLAVMDNGQLRFPLWQFDSDGPNGVVRGLPDVLRALDVSPLARASWMTLPNPYLEHRTPLQAIKEGDVERVIDQARAVGAV